MQLLQPRPAPADEHDGYSAVKYYSTFQEPGKKQHATHGSAGDLAALDQVEDPQRTVSACLPFTDLLLTFMHQVSGFMQSTLLNRPQSSSAKPGRSDIEERLANDPNTTTSSTTTSSYSVQPAKVR